MPERLIAEVRELSQRVTDLATHVSVSQTQTEKTRRLTFISMALGGLCVLLTFAAVIGGVVAWRLSAENESAVSKVESALDQVEAIQVTNCENANASREVHHDFWTYLVSVSRQRPDNQNPVAQGFFDKFQVTIDEAFGKRSCAVKDLNKSYPPPEFPKIPTPEEIEEAQTP